MAKHEKFRVEKIPPISEQERQELRRKVGDVGRVSLRANKWNGKRNPLPPSRGGKKGR